MLCKIWQGLLQFWLNFVQANYKLEGNFFAPFAVAMIVVVLFIYAVPVNIVI